MDNSVSHGWRSLRLWFGRLERLDLAVMAPIGEVNHQADKQPNNQPSPVHPAQLVHHVAVGNDAENRYQWHPGSPKRPGLIGISAAQHHHGNGDDHEGKQRADVNHSAYIINGSNCAYNAGQQPDKNGVLPRSTKLGMDGSEKLAWQQAII